MTRRRRPTDAERIGAALRQAGTGNAAGRLEAMPGPRTSGGGVAAQGGGAANPQTQHVTLYATADQTGTAGEKVGWNVLGSFPVAARGFGTLLSNLQTDGVVFDVSIDVVGTGVLAVRVYLAEEVTGEVTWTHTRAGVTTELERRSGTFDTIAGPVHLPDLRPKDTIALVIDGTSWEVESGEVQLTVWNFGGPTSPPTMTYPDLVVQHGAVAYWRLAETEGTTATDEIGSFDGTYRGSYTLGVTGLLTGDENAAADFETAGDVLVATDSAFAFAGLAPYTVAAWFKADAVSGNQHIVSNRLEGESVDDGWLLRLDGSQLRTRRRADGGVVGSVTAGTIVAGQRHYGVTTFDGTTLRLYLDGALIGSTSAVGEMQDVNADLSIGRRADTLYGFAGVIDEVSITPRALTSDEISRRWAIGSGGPL